MGGPRQVGKTTLSFQLLHSGDEAHPAYLNWDIPRIQRMLLQGEIPMGEKLIVLDEIHKYKKWRNLVKGFYDGHKSKISFLITGSARLDYFRKGGDSLQGRYHYYRLHPLSLREINSKPNQADLEQLLKFGGFPEPFLKSNQRHWKRWQLERQERVIQEDLLSMESVKDMTQLKLLSSLLPSKVGSLLSIANLRQDLGVAFETADKWVSIFENLYYCFRLQAYGFSVARAANKEKKVFMWDWSLVEDPAARFENLIASQLLKFCHFHTNYDGEKMELNFYRDSNKRELDFVVMKNRKPLFAVECKTGERDLATHLKYFSKVLPIPRYYQVHLGKKHTEFPEYKTEIIPLTKFAQILNV
ncbi:MAG: ATP-binding protein [Pseudobdellovibrionaceae bacterium]